MMILSKYYIAILGICVVLPLPTQASAADIDTCRVQINKGLAKEQRIYRSYLFGKPRAQDADVGSVRYDHASTAWIKSNDQNGTWIRTSGRGSRDNATMDQQDELASQLPLTGIFETRRTRTSALIPYALQSIRALECRIEMYCNRVDQSIGKEGINPLPIEQSSPYGCIQFENLTTLAACHLDEVPETADIQNYCNDMSEQLLRREAELLKITVEYDAGYRSLLQFAGNFDIFLRELRWPLTTTLRKTVELIGGLQRIPCFLSSCDASPDAL